VGTFNLAIYAKFYRVIADRKPAKVEKILTTARQPPYRALPH
jgi:hypothetical protein